MKTTPYKCHIFVCINDRQGGRKSCADGNSPEIRRRLKETFKERGWSKQDVRVSKCMCLGLCGRGPNVMVYPRGILFSEVGLDGVDGIVAEVESILQND